MAARGGGGGPDFNVLVRLQFWHAHGDLGGGEIARIMATQRLFFGIRLR